MTIFKLASKLNNPSNFINYVNKSSQQNSTFILFVDLKTTVSKLQHHNPQKAKNTQSNQSTVKPFKSDRVKRPYLFSTKKPR
jgi:hypothetical protein